MGHGREMGREGAGGGGVKLRKFQSQINLRFFTSKLSISKNVYGKHLPPLLAETLLLK